LFFFFHFSWSQFAQYMQTSVRLTFIHLRITKPVDLAYLFQKNQFWRQCAVQYMKAHNQISSYGVLCSIPRCAVLFGKSIM
jgi:hypothetical protein